jgi:hypothetical protein
VFACSRSEQASAQGFREFLHDEPVRVVDHALQFAIRYVAVEHDGVPVGFVHVVAGFDGFEHVAQLYRFIRLTLQIDMDVLAFPKIPRKHFALDFVDVGVEAEGVIFTGFGFGKHVLLDLRLIHVFYRIV